MAKDAADNGQEINNQVFAMKEDMKQTLDYMQPDNLGDCFGLLTSQFQVLQQLYEIEQLKNNMGMIGKPSVDGDDASSEPLISDTAAPTALSLIADAAPSPVIDLKPSLVRPTYRVERKLRGAVLDGLDAFIPEGILRRYDIEHGDYVYADLQPELKFGQKRYRYELAEKSNAEPSPDIVTYKGCDVQRDGQLLVVRRSLWTGDSIKWNDAPYSIVLSDYDIAQYSLTEGDVVDVAFYKSEPGAAVVFWKHEFDDDTTPAKAERKKSDYRKEKETADSDVLVDQVFTGKTICIIGDKPSEATYKNLIEERGGVHLQVEPKWNINRIQTHVKKSDIVVGLYDVSGHTGLEKVKAYCKRYKVPFKMISGTGKTKVLQTAVDMLAETS